jgi:hypothetical protein
MRPDAKWNEIELLSTPYLAAGSKEGAQVCLVGFSNELLATHYRDVTACSSGIECSVMTMDTRDLQEYALLMGAALVVATNAACDVDTKDEFMEVCFRHKDLRQNSTN